jgi:hypothetical protein
VTVILAGIVAVKFLPGGEEPPPQEPVETAAPAAEETSRVAKIEIPAEETVVDVPVQPPPQEQRIPESGSRPVRDGGLGKVLERLRRPQPLGEQDFQALGGVVREGLRNRPDDDTLQALGAFAEGGEAYARGDDETARGKLEEMRSRFGGRITQTGLLAWLVTAGSGDGTVEDWELAVVYGDARGEGNALVERAMQEDPGNARLRFGRALLDRLHDRHEESIVHATAVYEGMGREEGEAAGRIVQFIGDEYAEISRWADAVEAYRKAVGHGGRVAATAGIRGGQIALEQMRDRTAALELFRASCRAGNRQACRRIAGMERKRSR